MMVWYVNLPSGQYVNLGVALAVRYHSENSVEVLHDPNQDGLLYVGQDAVAILAALQTAQEAHVRDIAVWHPDDYLPRHQSEQGTE